MGLPPEAVSAGEGGADDFGGRLGVGSEERRLCLGRVFGFGFRARGSGRSISFSARVMELKKDVKDVHE